jgi:uncharacterized membrane protein YhaH (DUF805 family)
VGVFARPDLTVTSRVPGEEYGSTVVSRNGGKAQRGSTSGDASATLVRIIDDAMKVIVVLVVLAVLVAVARLLVARWRARERSGTAEGTAADLVPETLLRQARESEELLAQGTPANGVIAAWVGLEEAVHSAGVTVNRSRTSEELVTTVLRAYAVDPAALAELGALYREARFSRHDVTEPMRAQARRALQRVQADLHRQLGHSPTPAGAPRDRAGR